MVVQVKPDGPCPARVMIVGEAPGAEEERLGVPFVGTSGQELNRMLQEAGISRSECFVTNLCRERPPKNDIELFIRKPTKFTKKITKADGKRLALGIDPYKFVRFRDKLVDPRIVSGFELLKKEISLVHPNIIIPVGNSSLWSLTGRWGITKWRGSLLGTDTQVPGRPAADQPISPVQIPWRVVPTYHPAAVLRQWDWRAITVADLRRAARFRDGTAYPASGHQFTISPSFDQVRDTFDLLIRRLESSLLRLSFDIETRSGHIACVGLAWSYTAALCIPLMQIGKREGYWTLEQESFIVWMLAKILTHPNVRVVGQNIIYDSQYTWRHWHFVPRVSQDTMISQHSIFSSQPKALYFLASMYCNYYVYWKGEGKDFYENV